MAVQYNSTKYNPLAGEKVVVIGGSSGIGFGAAEAFLDRQAIAFIGSSSEAKLNAAVGAMRRSYPQGEVFSKVVDVTDDASVQSFFEWVDATGSKGVDHVIITAGKVPAPGITFDNFKAEDLVEAMNHRFSGNLRVVKHSKSLYRKGGSLTLTTGILAYKPLPGLAIASGLAGSVESLTRGLALDLAPIRVNAVAPGLVDTPLLDAFGPQKDMLIKMNAEKSLTKSIGTPEVIAHAYLYLASCAFVTGTVISPDGGFLIV